MRANRGPPVAAARRFVGALIAALLLLGVLPAGADTKDDLAAARHRLGELEAQISEQQAHLADIQEEVAAQQDRLATIKGELTDLAVKLDHAQNALDATKGQVAETQAALDATRKHYAALRNRLDHRARVAYEMGPASSIGLLLGSTTVGELSDRLEFVDQLSALDSDLAAEVQNQANELAPERARLEDIKARQAEAIQNLADQKDLLDAKFGEAQSIYADLSAKADQAAAIAADLRSKATEADSLVATLQQKLTAEKIAAAKEAARRAREAARKAKQQ